MIVEFKITVIKAMINNGIQNNNTKDQLELKCSFDLAIVHEASKHQPTPKHS